MTDLKIRIKNAQEKNKKKPLKKPYFKNTPFRVSIELVAGIMVGTGMGYWFDRTFNMSPWCLVVGFFLGCSAGFYNVYRYSQKLKDEL